MKRDHWVEVRYFPATYTVMIPQFVTVRRVPRELAGEVKRMPRTLATKTLREEMREKFRTWSNK